MWRRAHDDLRLDGSRISLVDWDPVVEGIERLGDEPREMRIWQALLTLVFVALTLGVAPARAQRPDTVILRSGNPVIGEVKSLRHGSLAVDTDEMDIVNIDWDHIAFVTSAQFFEVELVSGEQLYGSLTSPDTAVLVVVGTAGPCVCGFDLSLA